MAGASSVARAIYELDLYQVLDLDFLSAAADTCFYPNCFLNSRMATSRDWTRSFGGTNNLFIQPLDYKVTLDFHTHIPLGGELEKSYGPAIEI